MSDFKICPFCGEQKNIYMMSTTRWYRVACQNCGACGTIVNIEDYGNSRKLARATATAKWNRRASE